MPLPDRTGVLVLLDGHDLGVADTRAEAIRQIRAAAREFLMGHTGTASFCATCNGALSALAENGPLEDGLLMDVFWAVEAWEPPGPNRVEATDRLRDLARRIDTELVV